jgi:hypothetical protein
MASETVRIKSVTHSKLRSLAEETGQTMPELLELAVEQLRRERLLRATNAAYQSLRDDPREWQAHLSERKQWEATLADGQDEPR